MQPTARSLRVLLLALGDLAVFSGALALAIAIRTHGGPEIGVVQNYLWAGPVLAIVWLAGLTMFGLFDMKLVKNNPIFFDRLGRAIAFMAIATMVIFYAIPAFGLRPLGTLAIFFPLLGLAMFGYRSLANAILTRQNRERIIFFGISDEIIELVRFLEDNPQLGFNPVACVPTENGAAALYPELVLPLVHSLEDGIRTWRATSVVVAHNLKRTKTLVKSLFDVVPLGVSVTDFSRFYEAARGKVPVSLINETWFIENLVGRRRPRYELGKRALDIVVAIGFSMITLLLLPFITIAITISTPRDIITHRRTRARPGDGIIFFRQERVGRNGKTFGFIKFRSQVLGAERMGHEKGETHDPRAYPVGTFLRKTYLDELPQLWNVLKGDMSFIGPRPERPELVTELEREIPFYRMRELVTPGITGWSQINMENDQSVSDAPEKMQYDLYYIKNRSLALDITILLKTVFKILQRSGR